MIEGMIVERENIRWQEKMNKLVDERLEREKNIPNCSVCKNIGIYTCFRTLTFKKCFCGR